MSGSRWIEAEIGREVRQQAHRCELCVPMANPPIARARSTKVGLLPGAAFDGAAVCCNLRVERGRVGKVDKGHQAALGIQCRSLGGVSAFIAKARGACLGRADRAFARGLITECGFART